MQRPQGTRADLGKRTEGRRHHRQVIGMKQAGGLDMAAWDALAKAAGVPLCVLLGGSIGPVPAYNSNGLWLRSPAEVASEAVELNGTSTKSRGSWPRSTETSQGLPAGRRPAPKPTDVPQRPIPRQKSQSVRVRSPESPDRESS